MISKNAYGVVYAAGGGINKDFVLFISASHGYKQNRLANQTSSPGRIMGKPIIQKRHKSVGGPLCALPTHTNLTKAALLVGSSKPEKQIQLLEKYHRSNQDTCLVHKPAVKVGEWVESGDLLADNSASMNGELAIGKNILVAYMPWEGFNYEDAILINERLVYDD